MPRVNYVKAARKARICGRCGRAINPGEGYRYWSFRYGGDRVRCMRAECTPRRSELTQSKMGEAFSALETAEEELAAARAGEIGEQSDIQQIIEAAAEEVRRVADEYREADEQFGGGGMTDNSERADEAEEAADALEGFSPSADPADAEECSEADEEGHDSDSCEACAEERQRVWEELIDEAESVLQEVSL